MPCLAQAGVCGPLTSPGTSSRSPGEAGCGGRGMREGYIRKKQIQSLPPGNPIGRVTGTRARAVRGTGMQRAILLVFYFTTGQFVLPCDRVSGAGSTWLDHWHMQPCMSAADR